MRHLAIGFAIAVFSIHGAMAQDKSPKPSSAKPSSANPSPDAAMAGYHKKHKECLAARAKHEAVAVQCVRQLIMRMSAVEPHSSV